MNLNRDNRSLRNRGTLRIPNSSEPYRPSRMIRFWGGSRETELFPSKKKQDFRHRGYNRDCFQSMVHIVHMVEFETSEILLRSFTLARNKRESSSSARVQFFLTLFFSHRAFTKTFVKSFNSRLSSRRALRLHRGATGTNKHPPNRVESSINSD